MENRIKNILFALITNVCFLFLISTIANSLLFGWIIDIGSSLLLNSTDFQACVYIDINVTQNNIFVFRIQFR